MSLLPEKKRSAARGSIFKQIGSSVLQPCRLSQLRQNPDAVLSCVQASTMNQAWCGDWEESRKRFTRGDLVNENQM